MIILKKHILVMLSIIMIITSPLKAYAQELQTDVNRLMAWLKINRDQKFGLPYSHVGDERFENWTITYDAAITTLAYIATNETEDAKRIIDFYIDTPEVYRLNGIIEAFIPGYSLISGQDYSVRAGANLWIGIASFHLYIETNELKYLNFTKRIADFGIALQNTSNDDQNYGGICLGPQGDLAFSGDQHIGYNEGLPAYSEIYATEINIDGYALFNMLHQKTKEDKYKKARDLTLSWLKNNGYNYNKHCFNRGFKDAIVATDVQSWGISAIGVTMLNSFEKNAAEKIIRFIEENCISEVTFTKPNGKTVKIKGCDFVNKTRAKKLERKPLVSPEWTFQLINAYLRLSKYYKSQGEHKKHFKYKTKRAKLIENMANLAINIDGLLAYPYATQFEAKIGHEYKTPKEGNLSTIGVAYAILALKDFDPLNIEQTF